MDVIIKTLKQKKIKVFLIFFCFMLVLSCSKNQNIELTKIYDNYNKVIGVQFNNTLNSNKYSIVLKGNTIPVLGTFQEEKNRITFKPIIPFTSGKSYQILTNSKLISEFSIPVLNAVKPMVERIYPTSEKVPENLLKMYFVFSQPMQEVGNILDLSLIHI